MAPSNGSQKSYKVPALPGEPLDDHRPTSWLRQKAPSQGFSPAIPGPDHSESKGGGQRLLADLTQTGGKNEQKCVYSERRQLGGPITSPWSRRRKPRLPLKNSDSLYSTIKTSVLDEDGCIEQQRRASRLSDRRRHRLRFRRSTVFPLTKTKVLLPALLFESPAIYVTMRKQSCVPRNNLLPLALLTLVKTLQYHVFPPHYWNRIKAPRSKADH